MKKTYFPLVFVILTVFFSDFSTCFIRKSLVSTKFTHTKLYLFDFFKPKKNDVSPASNKVTPVVSKGNSASSKSERTIKAVNSATDTKNNYKLEKISYTQKRNYNEEFDAQVIHRSLTQSLIHFLAYVYILFV